MESTKKKHSSPIKKKPFYKTALNYVVAFFVTFFAFIFCVLSVINMTFFSGFFWEQSMVYSSYTSRQTTLLKKEIGSMCNIATGIPAEVFSKMITEEDVIHNSTEFLNNCFNGSSTTINTEFLNQQITSIVVKSFTAKDEKFVLNGENEKNINQLITACSQKYADEITIDFLPAFGKTVRQYHGTLYIAMIMTLIFAVGLCYFFWPLNRRKKSKIKFIAISATSLAVTTLLVPTFISITHTFNKVSVTGNLYYFILRLLNDFSSKFLSVSMVTVTIAVGSFILYIYYSKRKQPTKTSKKGTSRGEPIIAFVPKNENLAPESFNELDDDEVNNQ